MSSIHSSEHPVVIIRGIGAFDPVELDLQGSGGLSGGRELIGRSSRFGVNSTCCKKTPVTLPPGRARLAT